MYASNVLQVNVSRLYCHLFTCLYTPHPPAGHSSDHSLSLSPSLRPGAENWQDHWTPSYFPICNRVEVRAGDLVRMKVTHSELNIMFEVLAVEKITEQQQQHQQQEKGGKGAAIKGTNGIAGSSRACRMFQAAIFRLPHIRLMPSCGGAHSNIPVRSRAERSGGYPPTPPKTLTSPLHRSQTFLSSLQP